MYTSQILVCLSFSSEDDPFLLYATLYSGNHCWFVSRDLMRDHKASLPDGATRRLFFKWQRGHQLVVDGYVTAGRRVRFLVRKRREVFEFRGSKKEPYHLSVYVSVCVFRVSPAMTLLSRPRRIHGTYPMTTHMTGVPMKYHNDGSASPKITEHTHTLIIHIL